MSPYPSLVDDSASASLRLPNAHRPRVHPIACHTRQYSSDSETDERDSAPPPLPVTSTTTAAATISAAETSTATMANVSFNLSTTSQSSSPPSIVQPRPISLARTPTGGLPAESWTSQLGSDSVPMLQQPAHAPPPPLLPLPSSLVTTDIAENDNDDDDYPSSLRLLATDPAVSAALDGLNRVRRTQSFRQARHTRHNTYPAADRVAQWSLPPQVALHLHQLRLQNAYLAHQNRAVARELTHAKCSAQAMRNLCLQKEQALIQLRQELGGAHDRARLLEMAMANMHRQQAAVAAAAATAHQPPTRSSRGGKSRGRAIAALGARAIEGLSGSWFSARRAPRHSSGGNRDATPRHLDSTDSYGPDISDGSANWADASSTGSDAAAAHFGRRLRTSLHRPYSSSGESASQTSSDSSVASTVSSTTSSVSQTSSGDSTSRRRYSFKARFSSTSSAASVTHADTAPVVDQARKPSPATIKRETKRPSLPRPFSKRVQSVFSLPSTENSGRGKLFTFRSSGAATSVAVAAAGNTTRA